MKPFYDRNGIVIYNADCSDVLPTLGASDLLLTDPKYGIGADLGQSKRANKQHGKALAPSKDYGRTNWDAEPTSEALISLARSKGNKQIIWGGENFNMRTGN